MINNYYRQLIHVVAVRARSHFSFISQLLLTLEAWAQAAQQSALSYTHTVTHTHTHTQVTHTYTHTHTHTHTHTNIHIACAGRTYPELAHALIAF
jgi:hypothetical protein